MYGFLYSEMEENSLTTGAVFYVFSEKAFWNITDL